ncbi:hypothetical protein AB9U18_16710, partial [Novosphingobium sp. NRRL B-2648]
APDHQRAAQPGDVPTALMARYYAQRAGAGFMVSEGTQIEPLSQGYRQAIPGSSVARAIAYAIEQPADVDINAIVIRPTRQNF